MKLTPYQLDNLRAAEVSLANARFDTRAASYHLVNAAQSAMAAAMAIHNWQRRQARQRQARRRNKH